MMGGLKLTEVVRNLIIINVLFYVGTLMLLDGPGERLILAMNSPFAPESVNHFMSFQIVTHMFMHSSEITHLFFNMFTLFIFGPILENKWGAKKFLIYYLVSGFGALALYMGVASFMGESQYILLGASGAINGILLAFMYYYPDVKLMLLFPPIPIKAKYLIGGLLALDVFMGVLGSNITSSNTAHFAHVGGALTGFLILMYWKRTKQLH